MASGVIGTLQVTDIFFFMFEEKFCLYDNKLW